MVSATCDDVVSGVADADDVGGVGDVAADVDADCDGDAAVDDVAAGVADGGGVASDDVGVVGDDGFFVFGGIECGVLAIHVWPIFERGAAMGAQVR